MYEKCISCDKLGKECIPNLYVMDVAEIRNWARALKSSKGLSNADLAQLSGVPKGTIDYSFSVGKNTDVNYSTFAPILRVLIGCTSAELPCRDESQDSAEIIHRLEGENEFLKSCIEKTQLERKTTNASNADRSSFMQAEIERRNKVIIVLSVLLLVALFFIIAALAVDALNDSIGFFWRK